jgi:predicted HTH domain antitoxin
MNMETMSLDLPGDLLRVVSQLEGGDLARETAKLLALELFREDKISLGRAAELCQTPIEAFMEFAAEHEVPLHYGIAELEEDRRTLAKLRS